MAHRIFSSKQDLEATLSDLEARDNLLSLMELGREELQRQDQAAESKPEIVRLAAALAARVAPERPAKGKSPQGQW